MCTELHIQEPGDGGTTSPVQAGPTKGGEISAHLKDPVYIGDPPGMSHLLATRQDRHISPAEACHQTVS